MPRLLAVAAVVDKHPRIPQAVVAVALVTPSWDFLLLWRLAIHWRSLSARLLVAPRRRGRAQPDPIRRSHFHQPTVAALSHFTVAVVVLLVLLVQEVLQGLVAVSHRLSVVVVQRRQAVLTVLTALLQLS